ncbi:hypothetical protein [Chryseobacterium populi]|uniref:DUF4595 domain-containing protein n=1 Tax=Chryseobacterium populi TaxID=1144316 RepID=J2JL28_9FLAO|nr:hypothetical protein [Chryseobacterium populi]EJL68575.1 hypothetical protein PMI13_03598 [Chryseobacterium populi]
MKKFLFCFLSLIVLSCTNDNDSIENSSVNHAKIQTLTIKDEMVSNGVASLAEKYDFKFEYNGDRLIKVWDIHGNYTENLTYNSNNLLTNIVITGYQYPGIEDHVPLNVSRKLIYDSSNRLIRSENPVVTNDARSYTTFEYPSSNIIIAKYYIQYLNNADKLNRVTKIYLDNGNVSRVEFAFVDNSIFMQGIKYEYDQKVNPNFLIDKNRILGLVDYSFNIFVLQDFSQISKNNVIKKTEFLTADGTDYMYEPTYLQYDYQNNLPSKIVFQYDWPNGSPSLRVSSIYGY